MNKLRKKLQTIIDFHGEEGQKIKAIEELSELAAALAKEINEPLKKISAIDKITEEMADVIIMIEQLKMIYDISEANLNKQIDFKINRTLARLE
jgi:NTP pyrophosphatase (non-canonical NTP hydrolase)